MTRITVVRGALIAIGIALCLVGAVILLNDVNPRRYPNIAAWLVGAVVLHDGVLAPILVAVGLASVRARSLVSRSAATVIQAALVVGATLTAIGLVGVVAQARGAGNATVATNPYALALIGLWAVVLLVIGVTLVAPRVRARRARTK